MLILEMTGNYAQMLPLLVSCFCAYIIAEIFKELPIYESLLEYDLTRRGVAAQLAQPTMVEFILQPNAPFVGHEVRSLGLPAGCILVRCADGKREWVPKANTCLEAHMRISALVAPDAADSLALLKYGCGSLKEDLQPQDQTRRQM
jgi:CIC family chloride channel protein